MDLAATETHPISGRGHDGTATAAIAHTESWRGRPKTSIAKRPGSLHSLPLRLIRTVLALWGCRGAVAHFQGRADQAVALRRRRLRHSVAPLVHTVKQPGERLRAGRGVCARARARRRCGYRDRSL